MAQRISRAKQRIKASGAPFRMPAGARDKVLHVLYLIFNEGYASSSGAELHRTELSGEAIRLTRMAHRMLPDDGEITGLLALMLLTDARRPARSTPDGELIPLTEASDFASRLTSLGVLSRLVALPGSKHAGAYGADVYQDTLSFLTSHV